MGARTDEALRTAALYDKLREARGITDYAVAKATGLSTATISNWKGGKYMPKADKLLKIANYFGVDIGYFIS